MSRPLKQPVKAEVDPEEREAYDGVVARLSGMDGITVGADEDHDVGPYWGGLLNSPPLAAICAQFGTFVRLAGERPGTYTHADREFVDQVLCVDWQTNTVLPMHIPDGIASGVRIEAIEALRQGREEDLTEDEQVLARFIRGVVNGTVDDASWDRMQDRLGVRGALEYAAFILWLGWILRMMQILKVPDPSNEEMDQLIQELKDGTREIPDYRKHLR